MTGTNDGSTGPDAGEDPARLLPPLAGEDFVCASCGVRFATLAVADAARAIAQIPAELRTAVLHVPQSLRTIRPDPDTWSAAEYTCHVRDVYATYTIRLFRTRTEDRPVLEPMLNDLRARRFRYNDLDLEAVLDELTANVAGFLDEFERVPAGAWDRTASRLPHEVRTARWLVRQAMHEGVHHIRDIEAVGRAVADRPTPPTSGEAGP